MTRTHQLFLTATLTLSLAACAGSSSQLQLEQTAAATGFDLPESAVFDLDSGSWFVSNIGTETGAHDGDGFIARLDVNGVVDELRWVTGLDGPAGLAIAGGALYVADIDRLVVIDIPTATVTATHVIPGAGLLNDVTAGPDGAIYVSDTFTNRVHRLAPGGAALEPFVTHDAFDGANGLLVVGESLYVASTASFTDFSALGMLFRVDLDTRVVEPLPEIRGKFDGLVWMHGRLVVNDFRGELVHVQEDGTRRVFANLVVDDGLTTVADVGWDAAHERLMVPDLFGNAVYLYSIGR